TNAGQTAVQDFFAQVIELEHDVVAIRTTAVAGENFLDHGACDHIATGKVLGIRSVTLHEALAMLVDEVTTLTAAAFGNQHTSTGDTGRVELPHLDILHRYACTQGHANTIARIDQSIGSRRIDTTSTTGRQNNGLGADVDGLAVLDADRNHTNNGAILVLHQIDGIPFVKEGGAGLQVGLVQSVQQGVTSTVRSGAGTSSLTTLSVVLGLTTERTLINAALLSTREWQTHVLKFEHSLGTNGAHVFDSVLVADIVGTFDGIVHMPAPVIVRVSRCDGTGDATLSGNRMRASREHLGHYGSLMTTLSQLQRCAHARATTTDNDGIIRKSTNASHESDTPKNLHTPDEECE